MINLQCSNFVWVNGKIINGENANVPLLAHSLHYGSGVFEGVRFYKTCRGISIFRLGDHLSRFFDGIKAVGAGINYSKQEMSNAAIELIKSNNLREGYIRLLFYYGEGAMQVVPKDASLNFAIAAWPLKSYLDADIVKASISRYRRISGDATKVDAKLSGNYINSLLAGLEARKKGFHEALLLDSKGCIAEGPAENIFFARDNLLFTPKPGSILPGITRDSLIRIAGDMEYKVKEADIRPNELKNFTEAFFCGTATEIAPISRIDDILFGGKIGKVTQKLKLKFLDVAHGRSVKYRDWLTYVA